ncbi:MAG: beta-propeller domain-containing protein [Streptosporangiaceae bacterium]
MSAPPMRLVAYRDCPELLASLRTATARRVGPYGLNGGFKTDLMDYGPMPAARTEKAAAAQGPAHSETNVHEAGVDEPDQVKTDGNRIILTSNGTLFVVDAATRRVASRLRLPGDFQAPSGLLISGDRVLLLGQDTSVWSGASKIMPGRFVPSQQIRILQVDLGSGAPVISGELTAAGGLVDARQVGSVVRVVVRSQPEIKFPEHDWSRKKNWEKAARAATETNRAVVRATPLEAWQPTFTVTAGGVEQKHQVPCEQISRPKDSDQISMLTVLTVDLAKGVGDPQPVSVVADGETVYGTGGSLYVTGTPWTLWPEVWDRTFVPKQRATEIHKFDVSGTGRPRYVASGSVPGSLLNQYSISEYGGNLRVASTADKDSSVYVLAPKGASLTQVGKLGGLGRKERIYSVRFVGTKGYVVTFRQVDPLYVLDLNDPAAPRVTGELKITGYSAYLHPAGDGRIIGVGQEADAQGRRLGAQVSLFDVSGAPKRLSQLVLPKDSETQSDWDQHAFLYWPATGLTVIPVYSRAGGGALVLNVTADGVRKIGTIRHPVDRSMPSTLDRALVIGDTLWTVSANGLKASDPVTLKQQAWLPLPR